MRVWMLEKRAKGKLCAAVGWEMGLSRTKVKTTSTFKLDRPDWTDDDTPEGRPHLKFRIDCAQRADIARKILKHGVQLDRSKD